MVKLAHISDIGAVGEVAVVVIVVQVVSKMIQPSFRRIQYMAIVNGTC